MCRFNVILVRANEEAEAVLKAEGYYMQEGVLEGYRAYRKEMCSCGSYVGIFSDEAGTDYVEILNRLQEEKVSRLMKIKELMQRADYQQEKESFAAEQNEWLEKLFGLTQHITDYEIEEMERIEKKYEGEQLQQQIDKLQLRIQEMMSEIEDGEVYTKVHKEYLKFLEDNELMNESVAYFLTKEEEAAFHGAGIPLEEILEDEIQPAEPEMVIELESRVIDEVIKREKAKGKDYEREFQEYAGLFSRLLEHTSSLLFTTVWCELKEPGIQRTICMQDLSIGDLAFLKYDELLCIER